MQARIHKPVGQKRHRGAWPVLAAFAVLPWLMGGEAHAAPVYRCVDMHGNLAFQDTPCPAHARQQEIAVAPQALIGNPGERIADAPPPTRTPAAKAAPTRSTRAPRAKPETAWECHAANGEVFYRHASCPSTVAGDGVVRERYIEQRNGTRTRTDRGAWGRVPVRGTRVTRADACRRMNAAAAAGREGHLRDQRVSTYDRLMGRDPCSGG